MGALGAAPSGTGRRGRWVVVGLWLAAAVVLAPVGSQLPDVTSDEYVLPGGTPTARISDTLERRFDGGDERLALLVYRRAGGLTDADRDAIATEARRAAEVELVARAIPPVGSGSRPGLVSPTGDVAVTLLPLEVGEVFRVVPTIEELRTLHPADDGLELSVTGFPAITADYNSAIKEADVKLLGVTVLLVLVLLFAVYRSALLALVPLVVVGIAYAIVTGIVYGLNRAGLLPVDSSSTSLLLVLMFGAGTDYCLLLVARYRAALRRFESPADAMRAAFPEAAPAMVASGLTVVTALLAMLAGVFGVNRTLGPVNAIGIAVVLLAGLTLLPAVLVLLGRAAFWPVAASVAPGQGDEPELRQGVWHRIGLGVRRRPALWLAVFLVLLVAAGSGLATWRTDLDPIRQFRSETDGTRGYETLAAAFGPGSAAPTSVLVERPGGRVTEADLAAVRERVAAVEGVTLVVDTGRRSRDGRAALLSAVYVDDPFAVPAIERTERVRAATAGLAPALDVLVGSGSGERLDVRDASIRDTKVIVPIVLLVVLLTLVALLRAAAAPLLLLLTVVLSFVGTLGASLYAFKLLGQDGFNPPLALIIFIFLVALGSDYNIFLISRVREESARHGTSEGMLRALSATGPVITSAGLILAGTFGVLMVLPSWDLFKVGFAVALGVLIDTFIVRSICVPALVWLLGDRIWWPARRPS